MNFPPFGNHFTAGIPTIHQFTAKFTHENSGSVSTQTGNIEENVSARYSSSNQFQNNEAPSQVKYHKDMGTQVGGNGVHSPVSKYQEVHHFNVPLAYSGGQSRHVEESAEGKREEKGVGYQASMPTSWQSITATGSTVADYLSHLPASTLPLSLHHFLKYSAENIKKDAEPEHQQVPLPSQPDAKKKLIKKKKLPKEKKPKPKPGDIRLTTALDGSTLYCCPECHMAYPDKGLLEQHLLGHTMERRFFCDVCGAGLKRKDHLTRHKQSHNPDRPFICTVCMKAFKRKEQLTLHFVIHSGEKRHVCPECGKGFYRKDHLRKHTRSHIARRVKTEINQGGANPAQEGIS